ncbi:hypothetical protein BWD42_07180 [Sphingobacterium sp. CZ-UAM]|nr:hypothetical protein BWD42_07180 [Sphingobacterium sp. CZ-UAM]
MEPFKLNLMIIKRQHLNIFFLFIFSLQHFLLAAQQDGRINGRITDNASAPITHATIFLLNSTRMTLSDQDGNFQMDRLPAARYTILVSAVGYASQTREVNIPQSGSMQVMLPFANTRLGDVVVSAQKRDEQLQKLPLSISAFSNKEIQEYRLWNIQDLTGIVPNLYSANPGDGRNITSIRGITSTSYDPAVATYIDGINQFSLDTYIPQLIDVERIEVLRGPQSSLYGRNAMGGTINIITKQPSNQAHGALSLNVGNYGQQRYTLAWRQPLVKDKLFLGVAGMYDRQRGYFINDFTGAAHDRQNGFTGNYYLKYILSPHWTVTANVKHRHGRNYGPFSLLGSIEEFNREPYHLNQNATTKMLDNTVNASLAINYAGKHFNFSSQTALQSNYRYYDRPIDGDFSPIDGITIRNNYGPNWNNIKVWTQEFRISSPAQSATTLNWTAGSYFFNQNIPNKQATHFGEQADLVGSPDKNFSIITSANGKVRGAALFGQLDYRLADGLTLTAGLRYDYEHKQQRVLGQYQTDSDSQPAFETQADTSASTNFQAFSPKMSIKYELSDAQMLYGSYSRGYRSGGFTALSSDPSQPALRKYKPEYSNNYEIGIKNQWLDNRLRLNLALFYSTVKDLQVPTLILPEAMTVTKNTGSLHSKGLEMELAFNPIKDLIFTNNLGYTDATYQTLKLALSGTEADLHGNRQIYTPQITNMFTAQYGYTLIAQKDIKLTARAEWLALGKQFFDLANTISQSGYQLFNAQLQLGNPQLGLSIWGRNLGGKKYIAYAYDFGALRPGDPRTYGITMTARF